MNAHVNAEKPVAGLKKFGLWMGVIAAALISFIGMVAVICAIIMLNDLPLGGDDSRLGLWVWIMILAAFTAGAIWLTYFLNRVLKRGVKKIGPGAPRPKSNPFVCAGCGLEAPVIMVSIDRQIGAIVMRFHSSISGYFCRECIWDTFWKETGVTFLLGWWGLISFFITPIILINNVVMYIRSLFLPANAAKTTLRFGEADNLLIDPMHAAIAEQLHLGVTIEVLSRAISEATGVTRGQAYLYIAKIPVT